MDKPKVSDIQEKKLIKMKTPRGVAMDVSKEWLGIRIKFVEGRVKFFQDRLDYLHKLYNESK